MELKTNKKKKIGNGKKSSPTSVSIKIAPNKALKSAVTLNSNSNRFSSTMILLIYKNHNKIAIV